MIANLLRYGDYYAEFGYDDSADALHGRVVGIDDVIDFYGRTVDELKQEFRSSVDDYLAWCCEEGEAPQKTWSGKMTLRPSDEQHRRFLVAAAAKRQSVHAWMLEVLDRESTSIADGVPRLA